MLIFSYIGKIKTKCLNSNSVLVIDQFRIILLLIVIKELDYREECKNVLAFNKPDINILECVINFLISTT